MDNKIEIIGITTCGTYPAWTSYTVASFYNHVDKVIVVNAGYDITKPNDGAIYPLEQEHKQLKEIDIYNKIIEITPSKQNLDDLFTTYCNKNRDEFGRSTNITFATLSAYRLSYPTYNTQRWILKLDNDQILYQINRTQLESLLTEHPKESGFRFAQYADYHKDFEHISDGLPDKFTNDGSLFYKCKSNQRYGGQGSPDTKCSQCEITNIKTSHMRRVSPPDINEYEYFFKRFWYHTFGPNSIMEHDYNRKTGKKLTNEQILEIAHKETISILKSKGNIIKELPNDERIPYEPPLVCKMTPLEYIKKKL